MKKFAAKKATKGKGKKADKTKGPPKPKSGYIMYSTATRDQVKSDHPDWSFGDLSREVGRMWKEELSASDKEEWKQKGIEEGKKALRVWKENGGEMPSPKAKGDC